MLHILKMQIRTTHSVSYTILAPFPFSGGLHTSFESLLYVYRENIMVVFQPPDPLPEIKPSTYFSLSFFLFCVYVLPRCNKVIYYYYYFENRAQFVKIVKILVQYLSRPITLWS